MNNHNTPQPLYNTIPGTRSRNYVNVKTTALYPNKNAYITYKNEH